MTNITKRIIAIILMAIPSLVFVMGGVMKIIGAEPESVVQFLAKTGFANHIKLLGVAELAIVTLFLYPKTNKIGFLLASCYLGGALATEISGGQLPFSAIFLTLLWISMFLRRKEMFVAESK